MKDYFENEFEVGDIVAYPTSASSSVSMNHGEILDIIEYEVKRYDYKHRSHRMEPTCKLKIRKTTKTYKGDIEHSKRPVTVSCIERCINITKIMGCSQVW